MHGLNCSCAVKVKKEKALLSVSIHALDYLDFGLWGCGLPLLPRLFLTCSDLTVQMGRLKVAAHLFFWRNPGPTVTAFVIYTLNRTIPYISLRDFASTLLWFNWIRPWIHTTWQQFSTNVLELMNTLVLKLLATTLLAWAHILVDRMSTDSCYHLTCRFPFLSLFSRFDLL